MMFLLSLRMLRQHRWAYAGMGVIVCAASVLVSASLQLHAAAGAGGIVTEGLTRNETARALLHAESAQLATGFMVALGAFVGGLLVSQTIGFIIEGRRREIALLRLTGATTPRVVWMLVLECVTLTTVAASLGSLLSILLLEPYAGLLAASKNWSAAIPVRADLGAVAACILWSAAIAAACAFLGARKISKVPAAEAVRALSATARRFPWLRASTGAVGVAAVVVFLLVPVPGTSYQVLTALVAAGAVVAVTSFAPSVVPFVARMLGGALSTLAPGASLVAREQTRFAAGRTATLALPIVLLLTVGGTFGMLAQTGRAEGALGFQQVKRADLVLDIQDPGLAAEAASIVLPPELGATTSLSLIETWSWGSEHRSASDFLAIVGVDPKTLPEFVSLEVIDGSLASLGGTNVAAVRGTAEVGELLAVTDALGQPREFLVVATINPTSLVFGSLLVDSAALLPLEQAQSSTVFIDVPDTAGTEDVAESGADGSKATAAIAALEAAVPAAAVLSKDDWVSVRTERLTSTQVTAIVTIVGGAAVLAMASLALNTLAVARGRGRELQLLLRIGAGNLGALSSLVIEALITAVTALLVAGGVLAVVYARMSSALTEVGTGIAPVVPTQTLTGVVALTVGTALVSALSGALLALRGLSQARSHRTRAPLSRAPRGLR